MVVGDIIKMENNQFVAVSHTYLFLLQNIDCGYSNEYPQSMFLSKKIRNSDHSFEIRYNLILFKMVAGTVK